MGLDPLTAAFIAVEENVDKLRGPDGKAGIEGPQGPKGPKGDTGPIGPPGEDGQDGAPGKDGADGQPGREGQDGLDGEGIRWRGNWKSGFVYAAQDAVEIDGSSYIARERTRTKPPKAPWDLMAKAGASGTVLLARPGGGGGSSGGGSALEVKNEGVSLDTAVTSIDVTGTGATASVVGHAVTIDVPASAGGAAPLVTLVRTTFVCPPGTDFTVPFEVRLRNEFQSVTGSGVISGGTWDITGPFTIGVHETIPWDVDAAALQAIVDPGATGIVVTGGPLASAPFVFEYIGANGDSDIDPLTVDGTNLTGVVPVITAATDEEGGVTPGFASQVTFFRSDWTNDDELVIPAPGAAWVQARVHQSAGPFVPGVNIFVEVLADSADLSSGNVIGRNALDGDSFNIYDGGAYFATAAAWMVQESGSASITIHVQHDGAVDMTMQVKILVLFMAAA